MANDRSKFFFNVLALENILEALTRESGDGPCFLYIKFSKTAPRIFIFSVVLGAENLSYVKSIVTHAGTFLTLNILSIGTVLGQTNCDSLSSGT